MKNDGAKLAAGPLAEQQEVLLSCYIDGECGMLGRLRAQALLRRSAAARAFVSGLRAVHEEVQDYDAAFPSAPEGLWAGIERRIAQEERLRDIREESREHWFQPFAYYFGRLSWGAAGGFAAAGLLFAVMNFGRVSVPLQMAKGAGATASRPVQLASEGVSPQVIDAGFSSGAPSVGASSPFAYLRSSGRVKVMRKAPKRSTIFWIRKKEEAPVAPDRNGAGVFYLDRDTQPAQILQGD